MHDSDDASGDSAAVTAGASMRGNKPVLTMSFMRAVGVLASGTVIAQVVLLAASPVLTRLFTPAQFGELAIFTSVGAIAVLIATGRYEYAIVLPGNEEDARRLTWLVILIGAIASVVYGLLILGMRGGGRLISVRLEAYVSAPWVLFLPVYTILAATLTGLQYWQLRHSHYRAMAYSNFGQSTFSTLISLSTGYMVIQHGLIYGLLGGLVAAIGTLLVGGVRFPASIPAINSVWPLARRHANFPRFSIVGDLTAALSQNIIPLMFAAVYAPNVVGYFALASRILRIPSVVFTSSIGNVFRNEAVKALNDQGHCTGVYRAARRRLITLGVPSYLLLGFVSPWAFEWLFGADWGEAGRFAQWICVLAAIEFVAVPLNTLFYIRGAQKIYMWLQFGNATSCGIAAIAADAAWSEPLSTLKVTVLVGSVYNAGMLCVTKHLSEQLAKETRKN
jgi:O-antigen/teichoic acid export membrane protein